MLFSCLGVLDAKCSPRFPRLILDKPLFDWCCWLEDLTLVCEVAPSHCDIPSFSTDS